MKTAISLPDALYDRAERAAGRLGRSRSALYAEALATYLDALDEAADEVTVRLDEAYAADDRVQVVGAAAARRLMDSGNWQW